MTPQIVVWFKRDLRVFDHEPSDVAVREGQVLPLYVVEPGYWAMEYTSSRQWSLLKDALISLDRELTVLGQPLWVLIGNAEEVLDQLHKQVQFCKIVSHQETGPSWTYERDLSVKRWSEDHGIVWDEYRQHGVVRGLQERRDWSSQWDKLMGLPQFSAPKKILGIGSPPKPASDVLQSFSVADDVPMSNPEGGRSNALLLLDSFLNDRCETYRSGMSSPSTGVIACSRISTHLSVGALSVRESLAAYVGSSSGSQRRRREECCPKKP